MSYTGREFCHFPLAGISLVVDVKNEQARVALCAANTNGDDEFQIGTSKDILNLRLDAHTSTLKALKLSRNTFHFPYKGDKPRKDILASLKRALKDQLEERKAQLKLKAPAPEHLRTLARMANIIKEQAKRRRDYHLNPRGRMPGMGLTDAGMPIPAICSPMMGGPRKPATEESERPAK